MTFSAAQPVMPTLEEQTKANTPGDTAPPAEVEAADKGPGSEDDDKEADRHERAVVAAAMRLLQQARKRSTRTDSTDDGSVLRLDAGGKLDKVSRTTLGGARVPATLTRTGVLNYRRGDGSVR